MKPILFIKQLPVLAAIVLLILTGVIYSCKKDSKLTQTSFTPDQTIHDMQDWLAKQKTDSVAALQVNSLLKRADWKTTRTTAGDSGRIYKIVGLNYLPTFDDPTTTEQQYLVLLLNNGITTGYIYDLYGNRTDLTNSADKTIASFAQNIVPDFTGEVTVSTWRNTIQEYKKFTSGQMVFHGKISTKVNQNTKTTQSTVKVNGCDDWYWIIRNGSGGIVSATYLYTTCDSPGGGGREECPFAYRNTKGVMSIKSNCDTEGGGGGNYSTPVTLSHSDSLTLFKNHIDTSKLNNCFKNALAILSQLQNNCVGNTIDYFTQGSAPNYTWNMQMGSASGNNAVTQPMFNRNTNSVTTTFNSSNFSSGSDLAVARTILHESVHAYLVTYFAIDPSNAYLQYSDLVDNYFSKKRPDLNDSQHNIMVTDFISDIAQTLQQYGQSQGYNASIDYYTYLAWGGLTDTKAFKNLDFITQSKIINALDTEQNGTDKYGNPTQFVGKASNCP